jgi:hypothetical protein
VTDESIHDATHRVKRKTILPIIATGLSLFVLLIVFLGSWWLMTQTCDGERLAFIHSREPIPECLLLPSQGWQVVRSGNALFGNDIKPEYGVFTRFLSVATARPISHVPLAKHPAMASGGSNMHNDAYVSDVNEAPGPLGINSFIQSRTQGFGGYGTLTFDNKGRIVAVYGNARQFQLELLDASTLEELASFDLPPRSWLFPLQGVLPWKYLGAGVYFYLDAQNRAVVPTTRNTLMVIQSPNDPAEGFKLLREYDLSQHMVTLPWPKLDSVAWVMPEWPKSNVPEVERYWYATIEGMVGVVDAHSGQVSTWRAPGEIIENSFAVGEEGIFMMSDHALYRMNVDEQHNIIVDWRQDYDRGPAQKAGHITRGSGTSVTLAGSPGSGLVAITDNAEPQIHLELFRRMDGKKVCSVPLFEQGKSGTDLSALAFEHTDANGNDSGHFSIMVENNYGHHVFPMPDAHAGIARIDAMRQDDGTFACAQVWQTTEKGIAGAKLALKSGLLYMYINDTSAALGNYFAAVDFHSGLTVFRQHTGMGHGYNAWQGVLFLHPDNGALYTTTLFGLVKMQDKP